MTKEKVSSVSEADVRKVVEASRQVSWKRPSFMRELFWGRFRLDLIHPFPRDDERSDFRNFYRKLKNFLLEEVDSDEIDRSGEYPESVLRGLRDLGAFGMKITKEYGGLGFNQVEYSKIMELIGSVDGNILALLSAHQSIGVPQPLKLFGTVEQKKKYLPRCARGEISAFALTESEVGSDPARLTTSAELTSNEDAYLLNGKKLWCTNGTLAGLLVVMARDPKTKKISAFVVETRWPGVEIERRCYFMGLKALANAVIRFTNVRVPRENLIGEEGKGLKIALTTLNDGRLSIPAGSVGTAKRCLAICRTWANQRIQWGHPIGRHEAIAHKIGDMAAYTFAMESIVRLSSQMSDSGSHDIRLEAAATKEWSTFRGWKIIDDTMQIRGGRGYETVHSLAGRGEPPIGVERAMRDYRINQIFEGSSEIMHLFMAREAVDKHLKLAGVMIEQNSGWGKRLAAFPRIAAVYTWWYPTRWLGWGYWPRYLYFGRLATHLRFVERSSRKLARQVFHGMLIYREKLKNKQAFLFRLVDVANELYAMSVTIVRAHSMTEMGDPGAENADELVELFCCGARRRIQRLFVELWKNDDDLKYRTAQKVLEGNYLWMEQGIVGLQESLAAMEKQFADGCLGPEE